MAKHELIVNYLPQDINDDEFASLFALVGPLVRSNIARDEDTKYALGFGFVEFADADDAERAIERFNKVDMMGKTLKVAKSHPKHVDCRDANLYVKGLALDIEEDDLDAFFGQCGEIVQTKVLRDRESGNSLGNGFVRFARRQDASKAIRRFDGIVFKGRKIHVRVADEHGKKKAPLYGAFLENRAKLKAKRQSNPSQRRENTPISPWRTARPR